MVVKSPITFESTCFAGAGREEMKPNPDVHVSTVQPGLEGRNPHAGRAARAIGAPAEMRPPHRARATRSAALSSRSRVALQLQRILGWLTAPVWITILTVYMRFGMGWRIADLDAFRARYRALRQRGPVLICANHLTLVDSALIAWALQSPASYLWRFECMPWNVPEWRNFADTGWKRALVYLMKCVPIRRGGNRAAMSESLNRLAWLLRQGETVLIFAEGGRSRTGRIRTEKPAHGVGRLLSQVPDCQVLCVYLRGAAQTSWSDLPARGECFHARIEPASPSTVHRGVRGSMDRSRQVLDQLVIMESAHLSQAQSATPVFDAFTETDVSA